MRITLAAGLFAIGVELPQSYLADHALGLCVMVVPTMAFGWLVVAGKSICAFTEAVPLISIRSRDIRRVPAHQLHLVPRHCRLSYTNRPHYLCSYRRSVSSPYLRVYALSDISF